MLHPFIEPGLINSVKLSSMDEDTHTLVSASVGPHGTPSCAILDALKVKIKAMMKSVLCLQ